ncbi:MAG: hypothetical protein ACE37H_11670 [Phycisphaeraceae bacterium]
MTKLRLAVAGLLSAIGAGQAGAINIVLDYSYDSQGFFNNATAKATLEKAAADLSAILTDSFSPIVVPPDFVSQPPGAPYPLTTTWDWDISFDHPGVNGGPEVTIVEPTFAADEFRIYAGGRSLGGSTLGVGGPGGASYAFDSAYWTSDEAEIDAITADFESQRNRGQASGFSSWGGTITFDNDAGTNWHYDWQTGPSSGESDLYSVALHELMHALGWGTSDEWSTLASGGFSGPAVVAEYGGTAPITGGHWGYGTMSTVLRDGEPQETAMDPDLTSGTRKVLTDLDVAALDDIGWDIDPGFTYATPTLPGDTDGDGDIDDSDLGTAFSNYTGPVGAGGGKTAAQGDTDSDGDVDDTDLGTLFSSYTGPLSPANVPEPASAAFVALGTLLGLRRRHA